MKIAHVIDYFQPSLGYQETYLAKEQLKEGHEVRVFTSERYFPFPNYESTYQEKLGPRIHSLGDFIECDIPVTRLSVKKEAFTRVWMLGLEKALLAYAPDYILVHNVMTVTAYKVSKISFRKDVTIVYDDHMSGLSEENLRHKLMRLYFNLFMKGSIQKSARSIVSVTQTGRDFLGEKYGFQKDRLHYIPLGYSQEVFFFSSDLRQSTRKELGLSDDNFLVVYSGKINSGKGVRELVDALKALKDTNDKVYFLCIGSGDEGLESYMADTLGERLIKKSLLPPKELCAYYNAADVGVWPDGITASHIEANACGLPIVVSNWPASRERVTQGNGISLEKCSAQAIRQVLKKVLENGNLLQQMAKKACEVSQKLTWTAISQEFLALSDHKINSPNGKN